MDGTPSEPRQWLARYGDALYRYALLRLRSSHAAEDVVQETLLAAMTATAGRGAFEGRSAELTWLIGILRHKVIDHLRRAAREAPPPDDAALPPWEDFFDKHGKWRLKPAVWRGIPADDPHALLERAEFRNVLVRCLEAIPRRLARLFMLREAEGMDSEAICQAMEISSTNLWTLLHRARTRLRHCLGVNGFGERHPLTQPRPAPSPRTQTDAKGSD